jgi:hypothetical protein
MNSFQRFMRRVREDFKARRNLDVYTVSAVSALLVILALIPDAVSPSLITAVMLAALSLLVLNLSSDGPQIVALDDYLNDRSAFGPLSERIKGAHKLWIYAPSAANILRSDNGEAIRREILSHPGGEVRIVIQDPHNTEGVDILTRQLDKGVDFQMQHMSDELTRTIQQLQLMQSWPTPGSVEYRLLDYGPGFSLVAVDPDSKNGQIIVEFHGYHNESTDKRMNLELTRDSSDRWYAYWMGQFQVMWDRATAPALDHSQE